jgi:hypothetical protein
MITETPFYARYVKLPPNVTPPEIQTNPKLQELRDSLGAIDGVHVKAFVPDEVLPRYRNRKGFISQNVLAACTFDMQFCYIQSGWEGSAADGQIFADARRHDFAVPPGKYYLADAGFPACDLLLIPYRGVHYHLKEWTLSGTNTSVPCYICRITSDFVIQASKPQGTLQLATCPSPQHY